MNAILERFSVCVYMSTGHTIYDTQYHHFYTGLVPYIMCMRELVINPLIGIDSNTDSQYGRMSTTELKRWDIMNATLWYTRT